MWSRIRAHCQVGITWIYALKFKWGTQVKQWCQTTSIELNSGNFGIFGSRICAGKTFIVFTRYLGHWNRCLWDARWQKSILRHAIELEMVKHYKGNYWFILDEINWCKIIQLVKINVITIIDDALPNCKTCQYNRNFKPANVP